MALWQLSVLQSKGERGGRRKRGKRIRRRSSSRQNAIQEVQLSIISIHLILRCNLFASFLLSSLLSPPSLSPFHFLLPLRLTFRFLLFFLSHLSFSLSILYTMSKAGEASVGASALNLIRRISKGDMEKGKAASDSPAQVREHFFFFWQNI